MPHLKAFTQPDGQSPSTQGFEYSHYHSCHFLCGREVLYIHFTALSAAAASAHKQTSTPPLWPGSQANCCPLVICQIDYLDQRNTWKGLFSFLKFSVDRPWLFNPPKNLSMGLSFKVILFNFQGWIFGSWKQVFFFVLIRNHLQLMVLWLQSRHVQLSSCVLWLL